MSNPATIQATHQALIDALTKPGPTSTNPVLLTPVLADIINVWPAYQDTQTSGTIIDIPGYLRTSLIGTIAYSLAEVNNGFFQKYFFSQTALTLNTLEFAQLLQPVDLKNFGIALLSAAMLLQNSAENVCLNKTRLQDDLTTFNNRLRPYLVQTYISMYSGMLKLAELVPAAPNAANDLKAAISNGQFTTQINMGLNGDPDAVLESEWFLFNLWVLLKVLGDPNVDASILNFELLHGLQVPGSVGAGNWSSKYTQWFNPLAAEDFVPMAALQLNQALTDQGILSVPVYCYVLTGTPYFQLSTDCQYHMYKHAPF